MFPEVALTTPTREDVERLGEWLKDPEVNAVWFGVDDDGKPLHATYTPEAVLAGGADEWDHVFSDGIMIIITMESGWPPPSTAQGT